MRRTKARGNVQTAAIPRIERAPLTKMQKLQYRVEELQGDYYTAQLKRFTQRLAENPADAFSWGKDAITASAKITVGKTLAAWIEQTRTNKPEAADDEIADIVLNEVLQQNVLKRARWPEHSTSAVSNLMAQEITAAYAEVVDRVMFGEL